MKLSCLPVSYFREILNGKMTIEQWACQAKAIGFDGIDLSIIFFDNCDNSYLQKIRKQIEALNIALVIVNTYPDFTHPNSSERKRQLSKLDKDIAVASELGAKMVRVTAGQAHPETNRKEGVAWAVDALILSSVAAERFGIQLVYENHSKPGVWNHPDFSLPSDIFLEIADGISQTQIKILFDTANPLVYGEDPLPLLKQVINRIACIHAADIKTRGALEPVAIGTGIVPFNDIFAILKRSEYDGWISIEEASGLGKAGIVGAAEFICKTWNECY